MGKNSKYAKKRSAPVAPKAPTKEYISDCCSVPAVKPALVKYDEKNPQGLGKWRCGACGKHCKVRAQKKGVALA